MFDTCVPYYFEPSPTGWDEVSAFDYTFNDELDIICYYNHSSTQEDKIWYQIGYDGEFDGLVAFPTIKEALEYCQKQVDTNYIIYLQED